MIWQPYLNIDLCFLQTIDGSTLPKTCWASLIKSEMQFTHLRLLAKYNGHNLGDSYL